MLLLLICTDYSLSIIGPPGSLSLMSERFQLWVLAVGPAALRTSYEQVAEFAGAQSWLGLLYITLSCKLLVKSGGLSLIVVLMDQPAQCSGLYWLFGVYCNLFFGDSSPSPCSVLSCAAPYCGGTTRIMRKFPCMLRKRRRMSCIPDLQRG